jgi:hypothetical protein
MPFLGSVPTNLIICSSLRLRTCVPQQVFMSTLSVELWVT